MLCSSRIFGFDQANDINLTKQKYGCFCPMADMINYYASSVMGTKSLNTTWYFTPDISFNMRASKDIKRCEEIRDSYGNKPMHEIFTHYGFYIDETSHAKRLCLTDEFGKTTDTYDIFERI